MNRNFFIEFGGRRLGFQYSPIVHADGGPYMTRWIVYLWFFCLRLHKFYRGDHDRASHTHPWWFITFPFSPYWERVYAKGRFADDRVVKSWRPHFRCADFEHIVACGLERKKSIMGTDLWFPSEKPFWTFVIAGGKPKPWGFYKPDGTFIFWRDYNADAKE